jgi:mono/diheme cytochrome c family protein
MLTSFLIRHGLLRMSAAGIACLALVAACASVPELPPDATGPAIYAQLCQKCHGKDGWGDGPQAQWQYLPPANFHAPASREKSDEQLAAIIKQGVTFTPMHSYGVTLSDAQIQEVVAYIRELSQRRR